MGKYVDAGYSPATFGPGPVVCAKSQATAFDVRTGTCFPIFGYGIIIGGRSASVQGGFEVCNANFHMDGTGRPAVNPLQLPGPTLV